jgi:DNA adenine methylase
MIKSPLKWAGNKFRVLPHLLPLIGTPTRYCEPFGGSLSVALNVGADEYILNDVNKDLVHLYHYLTGPEDVTYEFQQYFTMEVNTEESFYALRTAFNTTTDINEKAKLFVYLNRHCFNGLTRYNKKGEFNVPFGKYKSPHFPQKELLEFRSYFLSRKLVRFTSLSFEDVSLYENLQAGDVVYFDPPYIPASDTSNFTSYATDGFTHDQQIQLRDLAESLANRGIKVILSNHDVPVARELYKNAEIYAIQVSRSIAANKESRKKANELIAVWQP